MATKIIIIIMIKNIGRCILPKKDTKLRQSPGVDLCLIKTNL